MCYFSFSMGHNLIDLKSTQFLKVIIVKGHQNQTEILQICVHLLSLNATKTRVIDHFRILWSNKKILHQQKKKTFFCCFEMLFLPLFKQFCIKRNQYYCLNYVRKKKPSIDVYRLIRYHYNIQSTNQ